VLVVFLLIAGLSMLFYPDVATWWNGRSQRGMAILYDEEVARLGQERIDAHFRRAAEVNAELATLPQGAPLFVANLATLPDDYREILYVGGIMGRVAIPVIGVNLPIFHTTQTWALDRGVGHLEGTAFPIGGYGTHSVLTAHTGLANARMFTDMERNVNVGDQFFIHVMGRTLAYEVDQILIILPHEVESMRVVPGEDLVTLMTCTPYTVNSHRLLVRGRRIEYTPYMAEEIEQAIIIAQVVDIRIYIFVGLFLLFMLVFALYSATKGKKVHNPRRSMPTRPHPAEPIYNAEPVNHESHLKGRLIMEDLFNELENRPPERVRNAYQNTKALKPALIGKHAPKKRSKRMKSGAQNMTKNIAACFIALLIIVGIGIAAASAFGQQGGRNGQTAIADFVTRIENYNNEYMDRWIAEQIARWQDGGELILLDPNSYESPLSWLHRKVTEHNRNLYVSGQGYIPDPFGYGQTGFNLSYFGFEEEMIAFITIPSIELELPIYMGASRENLHRGLAHVTGTSLPVGGAGSNAVIAGYMDLRRTSLLDNIGEINIGDEISITNFYETIIYTVAYIHRYDSAPADALTIQSGRDLISLVGYRQASSDRYTIVATRTN